MRYTRPTGDHSIDRHTQHRATSDDPGATCERCGFNVVEGNHVRCPRCWAFLVEGKEHSEKKR